MTLLREMTMRRGLAVILAVQCVIAILLVASDLEARLIQRLLPGPDVPDGPVSPGDQVRRYEPRETRPAYTDPSTLPDMELPADLPDRLEFTMQDAGEFGNVLLVHGAIESGDADRFAAYLASLGDLTVPVALNSPGGVVDEALKIGRMLRDRDADTAILPGMVCVSACPYMLAGGGERRVSRRGAVGMHQHYYETPAYLPAFWAVEDIQHGQGRVMEFLIEMGVEPSVMLHSLNTPPDEIYVLVEEELVASRLATEIGE